MKAVVFTFRTQYRCGRPSCRVDTHTLPVRMWPVEHSNDRWLRTVLCLWEQSVEYSMMCPSFSGFKVNI